MENITEHSVEEEDLTDEFLKKIEESPVSRRRFESILLHLNGTKSRFDDSDYVKNFFKQIDQDNSKSVNSAEVKAFLLSINRNTVNDYGILKMMREFDYDDNGVIDEDEFIKKIKEKYSMGNTGDLHEFVDIFKLFDANNDKKICPEDLQNVMQAIGEKMDASQCANLVSLLVGKEKDKIDFCDFFDLVKEVD